MTWGDGFYPSDHLESLTKVSHFGWAIVDFDKSFFVVTFLLWLNCCDGSRKVLKVGDLWPKIPAALGHVFVHLFRSFDMATFEKPTLTFGWLSHPLVFQLFFIDDLPLSYCSLNWFNSFTFSLGKSSRHSKDSSRFNRKLEEAPSNNNNNKNELISIHLLPAFK